MFCAVHLAACGSASLQGLQCCSWVCLFVSSANVMLADKEVVKIQEVFAQEEEGRSNAGCISEMQRR